jgi:serine/threonine protein kinase
LKKRSSFKNKIRKDPSNRSPCSTTNIIFLKYSALAACQWSTRPCKNRSKALVAVKTVKFRVDERPDIWRRFEREVKTLSKLSHPNVVTVYDCVIGRDSQPYVVMDYLKGSSLDQVLLEGRLSLEQTYSVASHRFVLE